MSRSPLRKIVACVGSLLIAVGLACGTGAEQKAAQAAPPSPSAGVAYTPYVTVTAVKGATSGSYTLKADPSVAIRPPGTDLTWNIDQPQGYSIEIDFTVTNNVKGPFPRDTGAANNPARGRYKATTEKTIRSKNTDQGKDTFWKYTVTLRDASNNDVATLDPIVIFK